MDIMICAGNSTTKLCQLISGKEGINTLPYEDISQAMRELNLVNEAKSFVVFDTGFFVNGRQLEIEEVFDSLITLANANKSTEILLITQEEEIKDMFYCGLIDCKNARMQEVNKLSTKIIIDSILGRYREEKIIENSNEKVEELSTIESVKQEPKPETIISQPQAPKPEKKKKPVPEHKQIPIKKEKSIRKREPLSNFFVGNKIIVVTGNPNSGGKSTTYYQAVSLANGGIPTLMVDFDVYTKGINFYVDHLDTNMSNVTQKSGLLLALDAIDNYGENIINISPNLDLLGLTSTTSWIAGIDSLNEQKIRALLQFIRVDYDVLILNVPINILLDNMIISELADTIVYCTNPTINGIINMDSNIGILTEMSNDYENQLLIMHKKMRYVLTNSTGRTGINMDNFLETVYNITETNSLHRFVLGEIPHMDDFDRFSDTKLSMMSDKKFDDIIYNITKNTIM